MKTYFISDLNSGANYNFIVTALNWQLAIEKFADVLSWQNMDDISYFTITRGNFSKSFTISKEGASW